MLTVKQLGVLRGMVTGLVTTVLVLGWQFLSLQPRSCRSRDIRQPLPTL